MKMSKGCKSEGPKHEKNEPKREKAKEKAKGKKGCK